jgi:hypothetical protein
LKAQLHILEERIVLELLQQTKDEKVEISENFFEGIRMG